jgi:flagellar assembly protein FliH
MQPWSDSLRFPGSLRNVRLTRVLSPDDARAADQEELLAAQYERGRIEGQRALNEQLFRQRSEVHEFLNGICRSLQAAVPQVVRDTEQALVDLALAIARKLVADLPISSDLIEAIVRESLANVEGSSELHVDLHPADLEVLRQVNSPLLAAPGQPGAIQFHSSSDVTRGGCLVRTSFGVIDARRETKLALIEQELAP